MRTKQIIDQYIKFFEEKKHVRIPNSSLVPENDPTTLFTSSGMQPLVPYLLGEAHPAGKRLVNVQNCFRAQDIDEVGDNRHTTFFRMLGNWSLGDYFKKEQIPWVFEFLTKRLNIDPGRLYVTVFTGLPAGRQGFDNIPKDTESEEIWRELFRKENINPDARIFYCGADKNWWSRTGVPEKMPTGEPGGPDTEVFYDFGSELQIHESSPYKNQKCHLNCDCGRFLEIANAVFMQYKKTQNGFEELPQINVDFGGGLERLVAATEDKQDIFQTSLFFRIIVDHLIAGVFIAANGIRPSNKGQGYILRRLLRRSFDNFDVLAGAAPPAGRQGISSIITRIVEQYKDTDEYLVKKFELIKNIIFEEEQNYKRTLSEAKTFISKKYNKTGDELMGITEISAEDAFLLYSTHGLSPTQIKSMGFSFDEQEFVDKMEQHQKISRAGAGKKFAGGLADHSEKTVKGHTATHLLHQALRDVLGEQVHQTGSNITIERIRFDFNFNRKLTAEEIKKVEEIVNSKIAENLPVHFEILPISRAKDIGAIGLFDEKYQDKVKVYFIGGASGARGPTAPHPRSASPLAYSERNEDYYSIEFCGGPHVDFTGKLKRFKIVKEESLGKNNRRIYAKVE